MTQSPRRVSSIAIGAPLPDSISQDVPYLERGKRDVGGYYTPAE